MKLPRPSERDVMRVISQFLRLRGALVVRINSGAVKTEGRFVKFNSAEGCSDLLVCYRGRFLALECKRDTKAKATELQEGFLDRVRLSGGIGAVVSGIKDVEALLQQIDGEVTS